MKNITTTILLILLSLSSYSQEAYRDTIIERAIFNEVNRHRDSVGVPMVEFNTNNTIAVPWAETLVKHDLETGGVIYHCDCNPGIEVIAFIVIGDQNKVTLSSDEIAKIAVEAWDNSPSHKEGMENKNMKRGFNAVYVFKSNRADGKYVALSVYQFIRDKEYYANLEWDENTRVRIP